MLLKVYDSFATGICAEGLGAKECRIWQCCCPDSVSVLVADTVID